MATRLQDSFGAFYALLERPKNARRVVALLLVIHTFLLGYSAYVHSPTLNEPGHLVAGLSYWKFGRFDIYNVNPPLVKMVAALPVMAVHFKEDWSEFHKGRTARPEVEMGEDFVAANGDRSFFLFVIARWACIPFSWLGAIICYLWARDLYGRPSGVMACTIWCFEPNILAHASLMTPDAHATALGLAACYTFWRWLEKPSWSQAALTGVVLGLAELAKTTFILFYPLWPLMWIIYRWPDRHVMKLNEWFREGCMLVLRMLIGLYVLNLGYGFEGSFKQLNDFQFVSDLFTGTEHANSSNSTPPVQSAQLYNRFSTSGLGVLPMPFPKHYILGVDLQQKDFEHYNRPSYLRGEWRDRGWWYYYLYATAIKVPLGVWALGILVFVIRYVPPVSVTTIKRQLKSHRNDFIVLFPAIVIVSIVSAKSGFSEHLRYVLPAFPFFFIYISQITRVFLSSAQGSSSNVCSHFLTAATHRWYAGSSRMCVVFTVVAWRQRIELLLAYLAATFSVWLVVGSLWCYPHSLSYFNEICGGPHNGPRHILGSNVDWGQDLRYLKWWLKKHEGDLKDSLICFGYYGSFDPTKVHFSSTYDLNQIPVLNTICRNLRDRGEKNGEAKLHQQVVAVISINLLYGKHLYARGSGEPIRIAPEILDEYFLKTPTNHIGYSMNVYE